MHHQVEAFDENKDGEISFDELYGLVSGERLTSASDSVRQLVEKMLPKDVNLPWTTFATVRTPPSPPSPPSLVDRFSRGGRRRGVGGA